MLTTKKSNAGFSLLEVVVSVVIISIILISIAALSTKSLQLTQMAQMKQKATICAREGIELVRQERNRISWPEFVTVHTDGSSVTDSCGNLARTTAFSLPDENTAEVTVTVIWNDVKGAHTVTQKTVLTRWI